MNDTGGEGLEKKRKSVNGGGSFKDIILPVKNFWTFLWPYRYSPSFLSSKDLFIVQCDQQVQITRFAYDFFLLKYNRNFKQIYYNLYWQISDIIFDVEWSLINKSCITEPIWIIYDWRNCRMCRCSVHSETYCSLGVFSTNLVNLVPSPKSKIYDGFFYF